MGCCFKAIGDPTRREILSMLSKGNMAAGEIARKFETAQPTVSNHLKILKEANLVKERRYKQHRIYSLNRGVLERVIGDLSKILNEESPARGHRHPYKKAPADPFTRPSRR